RWTASAGKSPEALDRSGFTQDGIGVQILQRTESTAGGFARDLGTRDDQFSDIDHDQFRSALLALASGVPIEDLKFRISARLFDLIQANIDKLRANIEALRGEFSLMDAGDDEVVLETSETSTIGGSIVNLPRHVKLRRPRYAPVSSSGAF